MGPEAGGRESSFQLYTRAVLRGETWGRRRSRSFGTTVVSQGRCTRGGESVVIVNVSCTGTFKYDHVAVPHAAGKTWADGAQPPWACVDCSTPMPPWAALHYFIFLH
jgi:hypothetical protein